VPDSPADMWCSAYPATMASLIALPDPDAPASSSSNAFPEYPPGQMVLGMFPDTTVFYRSTIVEGPKRFSAGGGARVSCSIIISVTPY
jgi:hypothetical protein